MDCIGILNDGVLEHFQGADVNSQPDLVVNSIMIIPIPDGHSQMSPTLDPNPTSASTPTPPPEPDAGPENDVGDSPKITFDEISEPDIVSL
ncbi:hypothetical protein TWF173_008124 [Orbilia oligospora]|nr:hypothetical protein TWF173_008124 [Orbilia oligospora]